MYYIIILKDDFISVRVHFPLLGDDELNIKVQYNYIIN